MATAPSGRLVFFCLAFLLLFSSAFASPSSSLTGKRESGWWCEVCEEVVGVVDDLVGSAPAQEAVGLALDYVCRLLFPAPSSALTACEDFVRENKDVFVFAFEEEIDAKRVCDSLEVCITNRTAPRFPHSAFTTDPSRVAVSWFTHDPSNSSLVSWSTSADGLPLGVVSGYTLSYLPAGGYMHHAVITGLKPATKYYYRVSDKEAGFSSESWSFVTVPATSVPFKIAVYGDMGVHLSKNTIAHVRKLVESHEIDWIYHIGDISYADDNPANIYNYVWNQFFDFMQPITSQVPYMVCPGNHEASCNHQDCMWYSSNFTAYNFKFRMPGAESGSNTNMWFSFDYSYAHFVSISTETDYFNAPFKPQFGDQLKWLEADLRAANSRRGPQRPWIIVVGHRPIYTSNAQKNGVPSSYANYTQQAFEELFYKYKVNMFITGHEHSYERIWPTYRNQVVQRNYNRPSAPTYLISGAPGGLTPWREEFVPDWSAFRNNTLHGFSTLAVTADRLQWRFINSADGSVIDAIDLTQ